MSEFLQVLSMMALPGLVLLWFRFLVKRQDSMAHRQKPVNDMGHRRGIDAPWTDDLA